METVKLIIDGLEITAEKGKPVLETALKNGIYIPHLCHHKDLKPAGICRVCLVEVNGQMLVSCHTPVEEGMVVRTSGPAVDKVRRVAVELLVADHHSDCLACGKNDDCKLQEITKFVGIDSNRLEQLKALELQPVDNSHPFIIRDHNKCVLCGICVRTCDEVQGAGAINFAFRGYETKISTFGDKPLKESTCESCGECMARCPVGALLPKNGAKPTYETKTICGYCGCGCGVYLGVRDGIVVGVRGDSSSPVNQGNLCVKGRFGYQFINHPDRLTTPLIKRNGLFEEASWDEALDLVASKFQEVQEKYGPEALGGLSSARTTNEVNYLFQKLMRSLGTNSVDHCARL
ncbi:MAG: (2Fe-2S)-binding protein [Clostridia bacterium]|jgi:formate dehydrogenase major subunit|nr:(2Fe-2S)-binding protein [Clostridia bacterium]